MRITQVTYVMQIANGPGNLDADVVASDVAFAITELLPVAGIMFTEARDLTEDEWQAIQDEAEAEERAVYV